MRKQKNLQSRPDIRAHTSLKTLLYALQNPGEGILSAYKSKPPLRSTLSVESIRKTLKAAWKDPGFQNQEFQKLNIIKNVRLTEWQMNRIFLPERSYKAPKKFKGFKYDICSRQFQTMSLSKPLTPKQLNEKNVQTFFESGCKPKSPIFIKTMPFRFHCQNDKLFGFHKNKSKKQNLAKKNTLNI